MALIKKITAREILDSRGVPTLEGKIELDNGMEFHAQVPSGESLGKHEGIELRDGDAKRYQGLGVMTSVSFINESISKKLQGVDVMRHKEVDEWLLKADGTENYSKLGVNTIMVVSLLVMRAAAGVNNAPLYKYINQCYNELAKTKIEVKAIPAPIFNMINGGKHGTKNLDFQEFHILPSTSWSYSQSLEFGVSIYSALKQLFDSRNADVSVSEEGGFTPSLFTNSEAFEILKEVLLSKRQKIGVEVFTGTDCAPSYFYKNGQYHLKDKAASLKSAEYIDFLVDMVKNYNVLILEDPLEEDDINGWQELTKRLGKEAYIVADDFIAGNRDRLKKAIEKEACNAVLVKFNQVGTMSEMLQFVADVRQAGMKVIASHRLGETTDAAIADFAVGVQADFVKFGSPARGERISKYNRLLSIETQL